MITLHESSITSFPHDNGIGVLRDVIRAYAEEELNGMFEFYMEYDSEGHLVDELKEERIIKAKAQDKLGYQLFRIYSITKNHENDNLIVQAQHITYDLADNFVESLVANNLTKKQVMELIGSSTVLPHPFNVTSTNTTTRSSTRLYRTNPLQMVGGIEGSILQIWGGQIERDNFNLILHDRRGSDDGVKVTYEKNITGLEATFDISGLVTRIFPFVYIEATDDEPERLITVSGKYIDSPYINDYEKIYIEPIDYSSDERINTDGTDAQIRQQLTNIASQYFNETGNDKIKVDMEVQFEHLWETEEYKDLAVLELVGMGDTVTIEHSRLKVDATAIVNYIRYDCIAEKNEEVRLGSVKARLTDNVNRVVDVAEKVEQAQQTANQAIRAANGKNTIYYGPDEPEGGIEGDLWFRVVDGEYTRTYRHDGIQWQLVLSVDVRDAMDEAQQAKDEAQQAVDRANQATQQATNAINQAQTAFDEAQLALTTVTTLQGDVVNLSTLVDNHTGQISAINQSVAGLQTQVSDIDDNVSTVTQTVSSLTTRISDAEGNITTLQQTSSSLASRLADAEGNITTLTATVSGLQTTVSDIDGHVSSLTQLSTLMQARLSDAEGNINTLTQTASSLQSTIKSVRDDLDGLEISEINLISNSNQRITSTSYLVKEYFINEDFVEGEVYTVIIKGDINEGQQFGLWQNRGSHRRGLFDDLGNGLFRLTFDSRATTSGNERRFRIYNYPSDGVKSATIEWIKFVRGNKTSLNWSPAPEDMATQSQITQLSDAINLRVAKGDVLSQINIEAGRTLIDTDKLVLSANTTHVTGDFKIDGSAHIKDASIGTAQIGTIDAAIANIINISANSIVGGILQSQNDNITFDLNNSVFNIRGGGQFNFIDPGNGIRFQRTGQTSGMVLDTSAGHNLPMVAIGISPSTSSGGINANHSNFRGLRVHSKDASHHTNLIDYRFIISELPDLSAGGFVFQSQFDGSRRRFFPMNTAKRAYDLGTINNRWTDVYADNIKSPGYFTIQNTTAGSGFRFDTTYQDGAPHIYFRGLSTGSYYYAVGAPGYRFRYIYLTYEPDVSSDKRLKTDITNNELGLDFINDISTKIFRMKSDRQEPLQFGILAQDLKVTLEHHGINTLEHSIVRQHDDGYYGVQATQLIFPTIKAVQELDLKVESVKDDVEWLKLENQYLRQKIEQLEEMIA